MIRSRRSTSLLITVFFSLAPAGCKDKDKTPAPPDAGATVISATADAGSVDIMQCAACQLAATSAWTFEGIYRDEKCSEPLAQLTAPACAKIPVLGQAQLTYVDEVGLRKAGVAASVKLAGPVAPTAPRYRKTAKGCVRANESATFVTPGGCDDGRVCRDDTGTLGCATCRTLANGCPDFEETRLYATVDDPGIKGAAAGGGGNLGNLQRCCGALAAEARRLGSAPEAGVLASAAVQCTALVQAAGPNGNAPEMGALKTMLAGRNIPGCSGL